LVYTETAQEALGVILAAPASPTHKQEHRRIRPAAWRAAAATGGVSNFTGKPAGVSAVTCRSFAIAARNISAMINHAAE